MGNTIRKKAKRKGNTKKLGSRVASFLFRNTLVCDSSFACYNGNCILQNGTEVPKLKIKASKCGLEHSVDLAVLCLSYKEG